MNKNSKIALGVIVFLIAVGLVYQFGYRAASGTAESQEEEMLGENKDSSGSAIQPVNTNKSSDKENEHDGQEEEGCPDNAYPVCVNGVEEFINACHAKAAGHEDYSFGKCVTPVVGELDLGSCPAVYDPVCADGKTYDNECEAQKVGATVDHQGQCVAGDQAVGGGESQCVAIYDPVCGDGTTYSNECEAQAAGANTIADGACAAPAGEGSAEGEKWCPKIGPDVCYNGITYNNECEAKKAGAAEGQFAAGACI